MRSAPHETRRSYVFSFCVWLRAAKARAQTGKFEVLWLGQSGKTTTPTGKGIVADSWLVNNPKTPEQYKHFEALDKIDSILVTHGHARPIADAPELAERNSIPLYALPAQLNFDGENYLSNAAAAVCAISTSLIPAPLTPTAPTISPSEKTGKPPGIVTNEPAPAASVMARA
jgi:glyoxylase-like metal-dependent hydrolase (beta-lactamase superfamily II)